MTSERRTLLLARQLAYTEAIVACEGVAARGDRALTRGARKCADVLTMLRDEESEKTGLRRHMKWSRT